MRKLALDVLAGVLAIALAGAASAQEKPAGKPAEKPADKAAEQLVEKPVELRFAHSMPAGHPLHVAVEAWAESIRQASNGTITIKVFPAQQLGKAFDHYNMARDGTAEIAQVNASYEPGRFPILGLTEIPFIFANARQGSAALDAWYRKYADKEMKEVKYCLTFAHEPATFHTTKKKVAVPADLKGMKIRPGNATISRLVTLAGGSNVPASEAQSRDLLEKGVAEGITLPWGSAVTLGIDRVTSFHLDAPLYVTQQTVVINKDKYGAMSPSQRKVIDDHCTPDWAEKIATPWVVMETAGRDRIKAQRGKEIYTITPAQLADWRKASEPMKAEWQTQVRRTGGDPGAILRELQSELKRRDAAY